MRYFFLLVACWLLALPAEAAVPLPADSAVLRITRLPANGLLLSHGWRYHAGDDPAWARPDFDDSSWDTIPVARVGFALPARALAGPGWFRLRLRLGDSLRYQALGLRTNRTMAGFELYLNGRPFGHYGTFSTDPAGVQPTRIVPAALLFPPTDARQDLVLAVRFAPWQPAPPLSAYLAQNRLLDLVLWLETGQNLQQQRTEAGYSTAIVTFVGGVFLLLGLLHWVFFQYQPAQPANRYFAFYALAIGASQLLDCVHWLTLGRGLMANGLMYLLLGLGALWGLRALYALFAIRPGWLYAGLCVGVAVLAPVRMAAELRGNLTTGFYCNVAFVVLVTAEQLRLTARGVRQRRRGAWMIGTGFGVGLLFQLVYASSYRLLDTGVEDTVLYQLAFLAPALGISLFLAREFALDSQLLQVKLGEVERLSAQTLAQEQEKQALLAEQNEMLEHQVMQRTGELQRSLTELRATQAQLIQKEKMASLGELTAGIAHEIQNPLNFVNNFSEVSSELLDELAEEQARPLRDAELELELVDDLRQNMAKITQHGQRAASIVRGMLEHSRTNSGERAPTDLNALCQEYLRLAYQGLRAKDKSFNAELTTDFAADLPLVEVVGADLGRVLLNLFANAFYAVHQRQQLGVAGHRPTVEVRTRLAEQRVEIRVQDNGTGMSEAIQQKIFQPFFTTKPTGEGTGLGLSLSYDIITQGHGGTLSVESHEGRGTDFIISLPA
ncbi:hypothetical protein AUC43_11015 [Hymenobacter sedentarius]|uniref:histidine kinase n=1 Tax=Hymenobacter sedentarius TaxID=1411621 RepID=A0A0U4BQ74_9BACT|nr:ATP-binding protein [Hymenobacter sedentarius]ALW85575.1 hypothetical protein AUC43_11015 [Hymenobacter sedentarius]